jgi:hypothetical protein
MKSFFEKVWNKILIYLSFLITPLIGIILSFSIIPLVGIILIVTLAASNDQEYSPCSQGKVLFTTKNRDNIIVTCQDDKEISHVWNEVWTKGLFRWVKKKSIEIDPD